MNKKLTLLAARRGRLVTEAAAQRTLLAQNLALWCTPLELADKGLAVLRFIKNHPVWIFSGITFFTASRPSCSGKWLRYGWAMWQIINKFRGK
jgi:YqjK-like protein